ncbi:purine-nucleoside phosphorylase [Petrotoga olearia]|uniref:Purine nucleoside phosphorylase n=2 Tax=Petrotoga olearia TaxID=156203 RepID=A0A2K1P136_9BACT|nr:purine-nucleoside phosphorylase [Petrotoga olearia]KUK15726.1 MAG: Purine nucleoside phosphorylase [Petrotoga mobilis]PNR96505.1 purine nucleoside phosphorylase [Petrotoga olearia DSM 13574]RMA76402.1 purine-nucleoside phosphorylase [Petrotoga olearia]HBT51526.1 purine-nucleoside phosphorylase [Petrotoga sp.]
MTTKIEKASQFIKENIEVKPILGLILGSGLGYIADQVENPKVIEYKDIPFFPQSTVEGHEGSLVIGTIEGIPVIILKGRFHAYEGIELRDIVFPIYVMKNLGVKGLIITNAAGGINRTLTPGDIVVDTDFINFTFQNPLRGPNLEDFGPRFPSLVEPVDKNWIKNVIDKCKKDNIELKEGTYLWTLGPSYETPSEIRMFDKYEADLVGMSTLPEVIAANHVGIKVISFSAVTNMAAGILPQPLRHEDVLRITEKIKEKFEKVVYNAIKLF